ncbi:MAG: dUTP diphosphatase [Acidobacteriota bacterium]|nr:dUTP diphosphatase [Acidobacteriota bacterium]MDE3043686.1 dUTP diphosphatase [Acidobacteriota bacterium]MDE3222462.1 dUTP diphosphatase [Acidobacteriota bacterium]
MDLAFCALHPDAVVPQYAHPGDAGLDLIAVASLTLPRRGGRGLVATGLSVAIPEGYAGFVLPRSGLATRHGVTCANAPGLIDAGYRGEIRVALVNLDADEDYEVRVGDRVAQLVVLAVPSFLPHLVEELPHSARGDGGFGSTGR